MVVMCPSGLSTWQSTVPFAATPPPGPMSTDMYSHR
jgi:hypothetical protein